MAQSRKLIQPDTFEYDGEYYWLEGRERGKKQELVPVRFSSYDPCPAFVIVATEIGKKHRLPREAVFAERTRRNF
jgi:hypothetical protein